MAKVRANMRMHVYGSSACHELTGTGRIQDEAAAREAVAVAAAEEAKESAAKVQSECVLSRRHDLTNSCA